MVIRLVQRHLYLSLLLIFCLALSIRLVTYYFFNYVVLEGYFLHPDSLLYHVASVQRLDSWKAFSPDLVSYPSYVNFISPLYAIFGPHRIVPDLINLVLGSSLTVLVYLITTKIFNRPVGILAAFLVAIDPLLIYNSTQLLRGSLLLALTMVIILAILYQKRGSWILTGSCLLLISIGLNRPTLSLGITAALIVYAGVSLLFTRSLRPRWTHLLSSIVVSVIAQKLKTGIGGNTSSFLDLLNAWPRDRFPYFTNAFFNELNTGAEPFTNYWDVVQYLPLAIFKAIVYPYPWIANSTWEIAFAGYMLWWYLVILLAVLGLLMSRITWDRFMILSLSIVLIVGLAMVGPIISGLIRWRLPIIMLTIIWSSRGIWYLVSEYEAKKILRLNRTTSNPPSPLPNLATTMDSDSPDD